MKIAKAKDIHGNPLLSKVTTTGILSGDGTLESPIEFSGIKAIDADGSSIVSSIHSISEGIGITMTDAGNGEVVIAAGIDEEQIRLAVAEEISSATSGVDFSMVENTISAFADHSVNSSIHIPFGGMSGQYLQRTDNEGLAWTTVQVAEISDGSIDPSVIPDLSQQYASLDSSGKISSSAIPDLSMTYATVDSSGKISTSAIPDLSETYVASSSANQPNGYVRLDSEGKLPSSPYSTLQTR